MSSKLDAASLFRLDGMVAAVTGGGTGIGHTMARALAINGASRVYILARRLDVLEEAVKEFPDVFVPVQCDVTLKESLESAVERVRAETGYINLLIANSGTVGPIAGWDPTQPLAEVRAKLFSQEVMDGMTAAFSVNTTGAFFTIVAFLELLDAGNQRALAGAGFGAPIVPGSDVPSVQSQVIVTSSIAAFSRMPMSTPAYAGSKAAILHLAKQASSNLAPFGIRVNVLAPGLFPSELADTLIRGRDPSMESPDDRRFIPARRFGGDEEMAGTLLYLAGRPGSYCNGSVLMMDGGRLSVMLGSY